MAVASQIKSLVKSFGNGDEARFFATAMQIAASEARKGHSVFAQELTILIDRAKKGRSISSLDSARTISRSTPTNDLNNLIEVVSPSVGLNDMVLGDQVKKSLNRVIAEQKKFNLLNQYDLSPRRKLLLIGAPGCGKTMTAQALAKSLGLPLFVVRLDGLISKFMGESIVKLRLIFDSMIDRRGVYLFDEFDSIGSRRNLGHDVGEIKRVLNCFLINIEKDHSNSIIIAATNLPDSLDKALFRRFDDIIRYPLPNRIQIKKLLEIKLSSFSLNDSIPLDKIAQKAEGISYSDINKSCDEVKKEMIILEYSEIPVNSLISSLESRKM